MKLAKYKRLKAEQEKQEIKIELYSKGYLIALKYLPYIEGKKLEWYYLSIKLEDALVNDPLLVYQYV